MFLDKHTLIQKLNKPAGNNIKISAAKVYTNNNFGW